MGARLSKQRQGIFPETRLTAPRVRHAALELSPKFPAMASDAGVDELVQNDIVSQVRRHDLKNAKKNYPRFASSRKR